MRPLRLGSSICALLSMLGCGSEPLSTDEGGGNGPDNAQECPAPGYPSEGESVFVGSVEGTLLDLDGNPAQSFAQVCGLDLCIDGDVVASGLATVGVNDEVKLPAFKYGDGLEYAKIALLIPEPPEALDLGPLYLPALPEIGASITAGTTAESAGVELRVAEGSGVTFDRLTYSTESEQQFRAAELPVDQVPSDLDPGLGFELYFALAPLDTEFCPAAELSVPNGPGWSAGTEVEFFVHGLDVEERHAPYGGFAKVAEGVVSEDGARIETRSAGLPVLSLVALRRKD